MTTTNEFDVTLTRREAFDRIILLSRLGEITNNEELQNLLYRIEQDFRFNEALVSNDELLNVLARLPKYQNISIKIADS